MKHVVRYKRVRVEELVRCDRLEADLHTESEREREREEEEEGGGCNVMGKMQRWR